MSYFTNGANLLNIGGDATSKTNLLPSSNDYSFDQSQGRIMSALNAYDDASGELLASGMDTNMPSTYDDLGGLTNTAMYTTLSPKNVGIDNIVPYVQQLEEGCYDTDLTSAKSMADRARYSELFSGL
jgi:hypothetical protein